MVFEAVEPLPETVLNGEVRRNFFLCVKEALNNAAKHAQAKNILVKLELEHKRLVVTVNDDGVGFDLAAALRNGGNGLKNMQQRIGKIGGNAVATTNGSRTKWLVELTV